MIKKFLSKAFNTKVLLFDNALVLYRITYKNESLFAEVNYYFFAGIGEVIKSNDVYELSDKTTLKNVIEIYREVTNYYNGILKK